MLTDANLVRVIVRNLVSNAIKFAHQGAVEIRLVADRNPYRIQVKYDGPGIPLEHQQRIFEPFERVETVPNKHVPGFGLGLATAKRLSEALGGEIQLESQAGLGCTFTLVLPLTEG